MPPSRYKDVARPARGARNEDDVILYSHRLADQVPDYTASRAAATR
jgi:hypothetical protein